MRSLLISLFLVASCTPGFKSYKPDSLARDEGAVVGRVKVIYNTKDLTSDCAVCFRSVNGPCYQLDSSGFVAMTLKAGGCSIRRIACNVSGERHFHFKGYAFEVAPRAKTYFGDVQIDWTNDQGFKPSQLFGLVGAIVDQSVNDGDAKLSVADSRGEILPWYDDLVKHKDTLPLRESLVSFTPAPTLLPAPSCAPLVPAIVTEGAEVRQAPDRTSALVTTLAADAAVCAGSAPVGYGYRRVKSANGLDGYVADPRRLALSPGGASRQAPR
jgi:hypothetical protein